IIVCHHKVSTYFGGHLMHQSTQKQKVQGNSRLLRIDTQDRSAALIFRAFLLQRVAQSSWSGVRPIAHSMRSRIAGSISLAPSNFGAGRSCI
ncbi:hypothetical protein, partial [Bradyrhizobium sp. 193]|uniref:hypothetical protein n=1 Tax=Bradyrhizobium sp. 193 TaxID=2782661 RepID=UPI001FFB4B1A